MRYLSVDEVVRLHALLLEQTGGAAGIRDLGALASSVAQPFQSFDGEELYPSLAAKAAAIGYFLISNHPFVDGNKRVGHAALEVTLLLNGYELEATVSEQEAFILSVAKGKTSREEFTEWVVRHMRPGA